MISLLEINEAINDKITHAIKDTPFESVEIVASDLKEPTVRPSIKTVLSDGTTGKMNSRMKERTLHCMIYFFASDLIKYKIENTKVQDLIENEFLTPIKVTDTFYIDVDEVDSTISDTVLICSFDMKTLEDIPEIVIDDGIEYEPMENLNLEME